MLPMHASVWDPRAPEVRASFALCQEYRKGASASAFEHQTVDILTAGRRHRRNCRAARIAASPVAGVALLRR